MEIIQSTEQILEAFLESLIGGQTDDNGEAIIFRENFKNTARTYWHTAWKILSSSTDRDLSSMIEPISARLIQRLITEWQLVVPIYTHLLDKAKPKADENIEFVAQMAFNYDNILTDQDRNSRIKEQIQEIYRIAKNILVFPQDSNQYFQTDNIELVPSFDTNFSLLRAPYYPETILLSLPIYTMPVADIQKIIWHELASLIVNPHNYAPLPNDDSESSYLPSVLYPRFSPRDSEIGAIDWASGSVDADFSSLEGVASKPEHKGWDLFWMYWAKKLNSRIRNLELHALPQRKDYPSKKNYLIDWRIAHLEEFIEDACSTFVFGGEIYNTLIKVFDHHYLGQSNQPDMRHPAPTLRLEVTYQLLQLMGKEAKLGDEKDPLVNLHGKIPGAKQLAQWIHGKRNQIVNPDVDLEVGRKQLEAIKQQLDTILELPVGELSEAPKSDDSITTLEELDLTLFARIDPNAGTSTASTSSQEILDYFRNLFTTSSG